MKKFRVEHVVLCEVRVWYQVDANNHSEALEIVSKVDCPTGSSIINGADYEIISDNEILYTKVNVDHGQV
jgi:hypothetical protein